MNRALKTTNADHPQVQPTRERNSRLDHRHRWVRENLKIIRLLVYDSVTTNDASSITYAVEPTMVAMRSTE
jgi:hypothetical protein